MQRLNRFIKKLSQLIISDFIELASWKSKRSIYIQPSHYSTLKDHLSIQTGDYLIKSGETLFMEQEVRIPEHWDQTDFGLQLTFGNPAQRTLHEALVSINGKPYHGIDRNRDYVPLPKSESSTIHLSVELYQPIAQAKDNLNEQNEPAEHHPADLYLINNRLIARNKPLEKLIFSLKTYLESIALLPENHMTRIEIFQVLDQFANQNENIEANKWSDYVFIKEQTDQLTAQLKALTKPSNGTIHMVGQSHIDLAWLWPAKEAVRKCSRTFSTMSTLLDRNTNFTYAQSQPKAFADIKEHFPDVFNRVKEHISSGRFELVGGMWVEPDLNIPSGESLVRQLLYGLSFYETEFGIKPRIEWLPDTFGYCASLPQILKKADMEYFMTTKMNWNDTNKFPYDLFYWEGIDGSRVLSYLNHGINEYTHPKEIADHWKSYKQKDVHPEQMLLYGHGDGGGGVTKEMISYLDVTDTLPELPKIVNSSAHQFFDNIKEAKPQLPCWTGDMYLELHRGTYTSQAYNKKANRQAELLYREAEIWSTFAMLNGLQPDFKTLYDQWRLLLFNQFHDIIPGTSIPQVYEQSTIDYNQIISAGKAIRHRAIDYLTALIDTRSDGKPYVIFNSLSWTRDAMIKINVNKEHQTIQVKDSEGLVYTHTVRSLDHDQIEITINVTDVPAFGYKVIYLVENQHRNVASEEMISFNGDWETPFYRVKWNQDGEIVSLIDKEANRELVQEGKTMNSFQLYHDRPLYWDAWDIDPEYDSYPIDSVKLENVIVKQSSELEDIITFSYAFEHSTMTQDIIFSHVNKRIDFRTDVDWNEEHKLLKVAFPVNIYTQKATYEIPFGTIERPTHKNTSWEQAQFEVCGHRFADLSDTNYGISLLNDSKYGYDIKDRTIRLSLLRAPKWPDPNSDIGKHAFTYSLYPHENDWKSGLTVRAGHELNQPVVIKSTESHVGSLPSKGSFIEVDTEHVVVDTVKPAENSQGVVVRCYESTGGRNKLTIQPNFNVNQVYETNLLEEHPEYIGMKANQLTVEVNPYEIKTYYFTLKEEQK
ncbi:alpha-mannosidase [Amphibacillus jilinensis]|uniref:alpha-mannosidase n=1 Tax=Amphibacillus jilinensis TaxID=1216008 RepID=UPI000307A2C1|nr:alpha-mannosidase [Amphibacillus jilinensis]